MNKYVVILDIGVGNIFSVNNACKIVGMDTIFTDDIELISNSSGMIIPGVGSFITAMEKIKSKHLDQIILNYVKIGKPIMGICLGMQLFFQSSEEMGHSSGIGYLKGHVKSFKFDVIDNIKYPKTQIGWNSIHSKNLINKNKIFDGINDGDLMYFANSYFVDYYSNANSLLSVYGNKKFSSAYIDKNLYLFQFHPEKSGQKGMLIYKNFKNYIL